MKKWMMGLAFLLLVSLLFFSCGKLSRKGTAPTNLPPEVFLVNIPPDGTNFFILSKIYWYGFDQDGYISRYQYLVIPDTGKIILKDTLFIDTVMYVYIDSLFVKTIEQVKPEDWNDDSLSAILKRSYPTIPISRNDIHAVDSVTGNGSWDNVMLFASMDTAKMVGQYFFVRGVDNEGGVSRIWKPDSERGSIFRLFNRTNRPPITKVDYDSLRIEYCLPETTVDWKGIRIYWSAQDPDYPPRVTPPLSFKWVLLGPFGSKSDINQNQDSIYYSSWDDTYKIPWVDNTSRLLVDLENAPEKDYGWYQFVVQARDDAFVPDTTPAKVTFKIIKPPFLFSDYDEKSVLLVDVTNGGGLFYPRIDSLRAFYRGFLQELKDSGIISRFSINTQNPPPEDTLSHYRLVIYINEGRYSSIQGRYNFPSTARDTGFIQIERYLRVGGRVWMIGYNNFGLLDELAKPQYMPISRTDTAEYGYTNTVVRVANYFCGVTGYFNPAMGGAIYRTEEMIAAEPYETHPELPLLEVDSVKLKVPPGVSDNGYFYGIQPPGESLKGIPWAGYEGVWNTNYNERLYTFISYKESDSKLHGRACASRAYSPNPLTYYDEPGQPILQWRTAEFCFPAFAMKRDDMDSLMVVMTKWFLQEEAYLP